MLPPILLDNEDLKRKFVRFCTQNVTDLNINLAREYIINTLLPEAFALTSDSEQNEDVISEAMRHYKVSNEPSGSTVWDWMVHFELKYKKRKKRFFVDTHESPANHYQSHHSLIFLSMVMVQERKGRILDLW